MLGYSAGLEEALMLSNVMPVIVLVESKIKNEHGSRDLRSPALVGAVL